MDFCNYFIKNVAIFGCYPSSEMLDYFDSINVKWYIDLTTDDENLDEYDIPQGSAKIKYPIPDRKIPEDIPDFSKFIIKLSNIIKNLTPENKLYLNCRGGHGRSGTVVACLLAYIYKLDPKTAIERTTESHSTRIVMKDRWRMMGSPQLLIQKSFIFKMFKPIYFYKANKKGVTMGFSNFSSHEIYVPDFGITFPTTEAVVSAFKWIDRKYHIALSQTKTPQLARQLGHSCPLREDWKDVKVDLMKYILKLKFDQHPDIRENLMKTGLRPIIFSSKNDPFWGCGADETGQNILGKLLEDLRYLYLSS